MRGLPVWTHRDRQLSEDPDRCRHPIRPMTKGLCCDARKRQRGKSRAQRGRTLTDDVDIGSSATGVDGVKHKAQLARSWRIRCQSSPRGAPSPISCPGVRRVDSMRMNSEPPGLAIPGVRPSTTPCVASIGWVYNSGKWFPMSIIAILIPSTPAQMPQMWDRSSSCRQAMKTTSGQHEDDVETGLVTTDAVVWVSSEAAAASGWRAGLDRNRPVSRPTRIPGLTESDLGRTLV